MEKISLASARVNAGLSQKEAAKLLGISNKTLCNWEKGSTFPNANHIIRLCKLYNITYERINFLPDNTL